MSPTNYLRLYLELRVRSDQKELLDGLDNWLKLGLISEEEVKKLCQNYLTCDLPPVVIQVSSSNLEINKHSPVKQPLWLKISESLREEFTVRWLLLLGIFLVIVSSVVLAASVWQQFSNTLQYIILSGYTIAFWITGLWLSRISSLPLTALTLQRIGILLIPVNFWAMDTFNLWLDFEGIAVMAIASIILTAICLWQNRLQQSFSSSLNYLTLSFLHWGWSWSSFPVIAIYVGGLITFSVLHFLSPRRQIGIGFIIYAFLVLLVRGIFVAQIPLNQLGVIIGLIGWLVSGRRLQRKIKKLSPIIGFILLLLAFIVTIGDNFPWQAVIIISLIIHRSFAYLCRYWQKVYCLFIFLFGLSLFLIIERFIPFPIRDYFFNSWNDFIGIRSSSIYNISLFIYIFIFLLFTEWLYKIRKNTMALFAERLTLVLGLILFFSSIFNPLVQLFNLILNTIILGFLAYRRTPRNLFRVNFAHLMGLLTIIASCNYLFPDFTYKQWVVILLGITLGEWLIGNSFWRINLLRDSCWLMGLICAWGSYFMLLLRVDSSSMGVIWLFIPIILTATIPRYPEYKWRNIAKISSFCLFMAQLLCLGYPNTRIVGFAVATVLMGVNYRYLRHQNGVIIHYGFILGLLYSILAPIIKASDWWLVGGISSLSLYWVGNYLENKYPNYRKGAYFWAKWLCLILIGLFSYRIILVKSIPLLPQWQTIAGYIALIIYLLGRIGRESHSYLILAVVWLWELVLIETILLIGKDNLILATANVITGLLTLGLIPWLGRRNENLILLPLFYAGFALVCRFGYWTSYTGLLTLGIAVIGIGVGSLRRKWQFITPIGVLGVSLGIYEIVLYYLLPLSQEGMVITVLALITALMAGTYRIIAWLGRGSLSKLSIVAHIHWAIAIILQIIIWLTRETLSYPYLFTVLLPLLLAIYALLQGRDLVEREKNWWIYVGIGEITVILLNVIDTFPTTLVCLISLLLYRIPWQRWGWQTIPWHRSAAIIPIIISLITTPNDLELITVGIFYLMLTKQLQNIRWSYLSIAFLNWTIMRWLLNHDFDLLWYVSLIGLSIIYISTVDPFLKLPQQRNQRHQLRLVGSGIIALVALVLHQKTGFIPATLGLLFTLGGLGLKIRAFLLVGTITFMLTIFYQLIVFIFQYSFLKWLIGLASGIGLITIAANFERSRGQIAVIWQQWLTQLEQWE